MRLLFLRFYSLRFFSILHSSDPQAGVVWLHPLEFKNIPQVPGVKLRKPIPVSSCWGDDHGNPSVDTQNRLAGQGTEEDEAWFEGSLGRY
jgi:hypothetical protein